MANHTHTFDKPWMLDWLLGLATLRPVEQSIAMWLAYLANEEGVISAYTWSELADLSGLKANSVRGMFKPGPTYCDLLDSGLVTRQVRKVGKAYVTPKLRLNLDAARAAIAEREGEAA